MGFSRVLILGASRGLGRQLGEEILKNYPDSHVLGVARKTHLLENLSLEFGDRFQAKFVDLSGDNVGSQLLALVREFGPTHILYVAGGGPYGRFGEIKFSAHQWAWKVTFESAAQLVHLLAEEKKFVPVTLIGSAICEMRADPRAASYSAAKHALLGLYQSVHEEYPSWDLRLFSPGYMDTALLPQGSLPRQKRVWDLPTVARDLLAWMANSEDFGAHRQMPSFPD